MGLHEEALRRIFSLDAGRSAQLALRMAQDGLRGRSSALVAIEDEKYLFVATTEMDDADIRNVNEGWLKSRGDLLAEQPVLHQRWVLLPVGHPPSGLVYIGATEAPIDGDAVRRVSLELGSVFELALSVRHEQAEVQVLYEQLIAHTPLSRLERDKLVLVLKAHHGNKTRAARTLGITRATLYKWIRKHGLKPA
jgi:Bacterial regulatory protein, Fis family